MVCMWISKPNLRSWRRIMRNNETELNHELLVKMFKAIRNSENKNIRTQEYDDKGMVDRITRYIEKTVKEGDNA